jgi:6-pyruvoyltetrahydropterin/6-carboxytetrahydropterin synthase
MSHELTRTYRFEAAHWLPEVPENHPCHVLHGHSYEIDIWIRGELDPRLGWVLDFAEIDRVIDPLVGELDHHCLNEIDGLDNPTSELLAEWVWARASLGLSGLAAVVVRETAHSAAIYRGPS